MMDNNLDEKSIEALKKLFLFEGMSEVRRNIILSGEGIYSRQYTSGEIIYEPNSFERALGVIASGRACVTTLRCEKPVTLRKIEAGEIFGAASMFGGDSYVTQITAVTAVNAAFISQARINELLTSDSTAAVRYIEFLSDRIRFLNEKIASFTAGDPENRVLRYLEGLDTDENGDVILPVSMSTLADELDIGRASLYRAIDALEQKKIITRSGKRMKLSDNKQRETKFI